jgi:hypothetical protein
MSAEAVSVLEDFPPAPPLALSIRRRKYHLRRWAYGLIAVVVVGGAADYLAHRLNIITPRAERLSTIQAMPEASLLVPGSQVLYEHGARPTSFFGLGISSEAFSYKVLGTNETQAAVLTFYTADLARRGWSGPQPAPTAFAAPITKQWQRGHYVLTIDILGPQSGTYPGQDHYATAYVIGVMYTPNLPPTPTPTA